MPAEPGARGGTPPATLADLHLPPTFVSDHCIRTLSYQGAMTPADLAAHWRVSTAIVVEVLESLKATGLVQLDSRQGTFERIGRVSLSELGQSRIRAARERTWYSGPLPVAVGDFASGLEGTPHISCSSDLLRRSLDALAIGRSASDGIGQAISGGCTFAIAGAAADEQRTIAHALGSALVGQVTLPYALFAVGNIVRVFNGRYHRTKTELDRDDADLDVLRTHDELTQWVSSPRPTVVLCGGPFPSDALPAYDEEAKFYVAPAPFAACGGVLAVLDSTSHLPALQDLVRMWLRPGEYRVGTMLLRSGERLEVPWHAATVLFAESASALTSVGAPLAYSIDIAELDADTLPRYVATRMAFHEALAASAEPLAGLLWNDGLATRVAVAAAARYLRDLAAYEGDAFVADSGVMRRAVDVAASVTPDHRNRKAAA